MQIEGVVNDRSASILVYGHEGQSPLAARDLAGMGYENVAYIEGGLEGWVDAGHTTDRDRALSKAEQFRYARHLLVPEVGERGQGKLLDAKVLLIGAGERSYYTCSRGWKVQEDPVAQAWHPEYDKPLGTPVGLGKKGEDLKLLWLLKKLRRHEIDRIVGILRGPACPSDLIETPLYAERFTVVGDRHRGARKAGTRALEVDHASQGDASSLTAPTLEVGQDLPHGSKATAPSPPGGGSGVVRGRKERIPKRRGGLRRRGSVPGRRPRRTPRASRR